MAISREGPIVGQISGAIGGVVFNAGSRSGVISKRPPPNPTVSNEQRRRHGFLQIAQAKWRAGTDAQRSLWNSFASTLPWTNRLSIRRPISGYTAWLSFDLQLDPLQTGTFALYDPPLAVSAPTPIISAAAFDHDGACTITTQTPPALSVIEVLTIRLIRQFGARTSPGQTILVGTKQRWDPTEDWASEIATAGVAFKAGDNLVIKIYWIDGYSWPSQRATYPITAT